MNNPIIKFRHAIIALMMIVLSGAGAKASAPWTVNPSDYRYDMSLYLAVAYAGGGEMDYASNAVAAFVGEECRGIAEPLALGNGKQCLYLRARSNKESGETMTFKYYNMETGEIEPIDGASFAFESNGRLGYPSDPFKVTVYQYYAVKFLAGEGGSVDNEGGRLLAGTEVEVTAIPDEGYHFDAWSDGDTDNPRAFTVEDHMEVTALFERSAFVLTYMVDGAVYKTVEVLYGDAIVPEGAVSKPGYLFAGWEGLPETMPAHDVEVNAIFREGMLGDVNSDGRINIADVNMILNYVLRLNPASFNAAMADVDGDGRVLITDVNIILNHVLKISLIQQ